MLIFASCVLCVLMVSHVGNWTAVILIGVATAAHQAWSANLFTTVSDMFPQRAVASVVGIGGMVGSFAGMTFPIFAGWLLDKLANDPTAAYRILFIICGCAYLVAFTLNHLCTPNFEQITLDIEPATS
jgi:ACS family hexuronate transporter-like MFS transporter